MAQPYWSRIVRNGWLTVALLAALMVSSACLAQEGSSALRGTVTDPSGAVVPGARIRVLEPATGIVVRTVTSDKGGYFEIPALNPGTYSLRAECCGFAEFVANDLILDSGHVRRIDVALSVPHQGATVEVREGAQVIDTEGGTLHAEFDDKEFQDAPLVQSYPNPLAMFQTLPGVQGAGWGVMINGFDGDQQHIEFDGSTTDRFGEQNNNINFYQQATVTEMNPGASSSRPVAYNLTSKRGVNTWHGSVHYQRFDSAFNAFQPPQNAQGTLVKPHYIQHDGQAELSGPIWKNKAFFYFSFFLQRVPAHTQVAATVPTAAMMKGDFSALLPQVKLVDPLTGQPFPNNQLPAQRISGAAQYFQKTFYPTPPATFASNNYFWLHPYTDGGILADYYQGNWPFLRLDYAPTSKDAVFVTGTRRKTPYDWSGNTPALFYTHTGDVWNFALDETHTFTDRVVNRASLSLARQLWLNGSPANGQNIHGQDVITAAGLQGLNPSHYNTAGMPSINFGGSGFGGASPSSLGLTSGGASNNQTDWEIKDDLSWQKGAHLFGFGASYDRFWNAKDFTTGAAPDYGSFSFDGRYSGLNYADFLLGYPSYLERSDPLTNRELTNETFGFYFSDTYHVTHRLSLDYGLRWDYEGVPRYHDNLVYNFIPEANQIIVPGAALSKINPNFAALTANPSVGTGPVPIVAGNPIPSGDRGNFGPRIAAAYRLSNTLVIRGGYGLYWQRYTKSYNATQEGYSDGPFIGLSQNYNAPTWTGPQSSCANPPCAPPFEWPSPFPAPGTSDVTAGGGVGSQQLTAMPTHWTNGSIHSFNVSLEKEIAGMGLRASYIGSLSENQQYQSWGFNTKPANSTPYSTALLPFPGLSYVGEFKNGGIAHYNALQVEAKRKQGWVTFDASFTMASDISNEGYSNDPLHPFAMWAPNGADTRNRVVLTSVWSLPFGKGRHYLGNSPSWVNQLVGGWTVESFSYLASGWLFGPWFNSTYDPTPSVQTNVDFANANAYSGYPDRIPGARPNLSRGRRTYQRWFNTPVYSCADASGICGYGSNGFYPNSNTPMPFTPFTYSETGAFMIPGCTPADPLCLNMEEPVVGRWGNASANMLHGDPLDVHHLSVAKSFPLTEKVRMTYTALISNLFNHPHYYNPDGTITDALPDNSGCVGQLATWACGSSAERGFEYNHAGFRSIAMKLRVEF